MRERTLRMIVMVIFLGLVGGSISACIVKTKRDRHGHAVKHRKHKKQKKQKKQKHRKHRKNRKHKH